MAELFRSRAGQFLAITECLRNSNRRLIQTSLGAPENDDCFYDVYLELFFAGIEIVAGGGGAKPLPAGKHNDLISDVTNTISLIDLASAGLYFIHILWLRFLVEILSQCKCLGTKVNIDFWSLTFEWSCSSLLFSIG